MDRRLCDPEAAGELVMMELVVLLWFLSLVAAGALGYLLKMVMS